MDSSDPHLKKHRRPKSETIAGMVITVNPLLENPFSSNDSNSEGNSNTTNRRTADLKHLFLMNVVSLGSHRRLSEQESKPIKILNEIIPSITDLRRQKAIVGWQAFV
jgi:hypothetical protein